MAMSPEDRKKLVVTAWAEAERRFRIFCVPEGKAALVAASDLREVGNAMAAALASEPERPTPEGVRRNAPGELSTGGGRWTGRHAALDSEFCADSVAIEERVDGGALAAPR
jgi:hypothetical protein